MCRVAGLLQQLSFSIHFDIGKIYSTDCYIAHPGAWQQFRIGTGLRSAWYTPRNRTNDLLTSPLVHFAILGALAESTEQSLEQHTSKAAQWY
jgi:hypothetical protein